MGSFLNCASCQSPRVQVLEDVNRNAQVIYFRCEECGCAWAISKQGPRRMAKIMARPRLTDAGARRRAGL